MSKVTDILTASGVRYRRTRWVKPPSGTYAVYMDSVFADGPDGLNRIYTHNSTIELYASAPDDASEEAIETAISASGVHYEKQDPYWIQSEQLYQTIYTFTTIEKRRT